MAFEKLAEILGCLGCHDGLQGSGEDAPTDVVFEFYDDASSSKGTSSALRTTVPVVHLPPRPSENVGDQYSLDEWLDAAEHGDVARVRAMIDHGQAVDSTEPETNYSALMIASEAGHLDVASLLVEAGSTVELRDSYGRTPLYAAAVAGHVAVVKLLLRREAKMDARDMDGRTPLWATCALRKVEVAALLVEYGADVDAETGLLGEDSEGTALDFAIRHGHAEVAAFLRLHNATEHAGRLCVEVPTRDTALV